MADSNSWVLLNGIGLGCKAVTRLIMSANHCDCQSLALSILHSDLREQKGEEVIDGTQGIDRQILDTCGIAMQN